MLVCTLCEIAVDSFLKTVWVMRSSWGRGKKPGGRRSLSVDILSLIGVAFLLLGLRGMGGGPVTHRFFNSGGSLRDGAGGPETMLKVVGRAVLYIWDRLARANGQLRFGGS